MRDVSLTAFVAAHGDSVFVVDVREPGEYLGGHVPGATLVPMGELPSRPAELPKDRPIYVICTSGHRSLSMTSLLIRSGLEAHSVTGATEAWAQAGHPIARGLA